MKAGTKKIVLLLLGVLLAVALCLQLLPLSAMAETGADEPSVIDFTTKMEAYKWSFMAFGSTNENAAARPELAFVEDEEETVLKLPNDSGINWSMGTAVLRYKGETAKYNDIEYKFRLKLDGDSYTGMLGQISIFAEKDATKWGNNAEYGTGLYAQLYDGHTVVLSYRDAGTGNGDGEEIGRVQFHSGEMQGKYVNFSIKLREETEGTYATVRVQDIELVNDYLMEDVKGKGSFGLISGNGAADIYLAPYNYYSESGLDSDRTPAMEGDNMQDFINKGYPSAAWANTGSSSVVEDGVWKITSNNGVTARLGAYHYSTAISDTAYNFRVKVDVGEGDPNYQSHSVTFLQRVTGDVGSGRITSAYGLYVHNSGDTYLRRYEGNIDGFTVLGDAVKFDLYDGAVHDISFATENTENGVLITVWLDGEKKIEYTDDSDKKVTNAGQFVVDSRYGSDVYNISGYDLIKPYESDGDDTPVYGVGDKVPQEDQIKANTVLNIKDLIDESPESAWIISNGSKEVVTEGDEEIIRINAGEDGANGTPFYYAGTGARQFQDYTMSFRMRQTYKPDQADWAAIITLRDSAPGTGDWDPAKPTGYDICIYSNRLCLRRIINGTDSNEPGAGEISGCSYSVGLVDGQFHEYAVTVMNEGDAVRIVVYVDGILAINFLDTEYPMQAGGYVSFFMGNSIQTTDIAAGVFEHHIEADTEPPVITLPEDKPTTGTVGEEITIPTGTLSDNVTDPALMLIERKVVGPDGKDVTVTNRRFTPTQAGTYTVTYTATDEAGNTGFATWDIVVTEGSGSGEPAEGGCSSAMMGTGIAVSAAALALVVASVVILCRKKKG